MVGRHALLQLLPVLHAQHPLTRYRQRPGPAGIVLSFAHLPVQHAEPIARQIAAASL